MRTVGEWEKIDEVVRESGKGDIGQYIRWKLAKMQKAYDECKECITPACGDRIRKEVPIYPSNHEMLSELSVKMKKPIDTVVNELIINPMLIIIR